MPGVINSVLRRFVDADGISGLSWPETLAYYNHLRWRVIPNIAFYDLKSVILSPPYDALMILLNTLSCASGIT
jgi:hypothetical protein